MSSRQVGVPDCTVQRSPVCSSLKVSPSTWTTDVSASAIPKSLEKKNTKTTQALWCHRFGEGTWAEMVLGRQAHMPALLHSLGVCPLPCHPCLYINITFPQGCSGAAVALHDPHSSGLKLLLIILASFSACTALLDNWEGNQKIPLVLWGPALVLTAQLLGALSLRQYLYYLFSHSSFWLFLSSCQKVLLFNLVIVSLHLTGGALCTG